MKVEVLDPRTGADWDQAVAAFPEAQIFHHSAWALLLSETYGHRPFYLRFSDDTGVRALVPLMEVASCLTGLRAVCLPFADFTPPLLGDGEVQPLILQELKALAHSRRWSHFELRGYRPDRDATPAAQFYGHRIPLPEDPALFYRDLPGNVRRRIQRGSGCGLEIEATRSLPAMWDFYTLLAATRRRHGVPPQPRSFFSNLHARVIEPGQGTILLARSGGRAIGGAVLLHSGTRAIYKFAASSSEAAAAFPGVNNLVLWRSIELLIRQGIRELHLGRTSLHNEGLRRFKAGWGGVEESIDYFRFSRKFAGWASANDRSRGAHNLLFSKLPPTLSRLLGTFLYPHLD